MNDAPDTVVLCQVPDYLVLNVEGTLKQEVFQRFEREQQRLRDSRRNWDKITIPQCPGGYVYLTWKWQDGYHVCFHNHIFYGKMTRHKNLPTFVIRIQSRVINTGNWDLIEETVNVVVGQFMEYVRSIQVSRIDLAVDFQSEGFEFPNLCDAVKRSNKNGLDEDEKTGHQGLIFAKRRKKGSKPTKNPKMQAILYNKSSSMKKWEQEELEQHWMREVHRNAERYREDLTVYRMEFRFFREMLREMKPEDSKGRGKGIETLEDLRSSLGDLTRVAVGDEDCRNSWLRFCDPETRKQDVKPAARWWRAVAEAFKRDLTVSGRFRDYKPGVPNMAHTRTSLLAYSARTEAENRLHDPSQKATLQEFVPLYLRTIENTLRSRSTTWEEEIEKHMGRLIDGLAEAELDEGEDKIA